MELRQFTAHRDILLRGWYLAKDGRLYHHVMTEMVEVMTQYRKKDRDRMAAWRANKKQATTENVTRDTPVTHALVTPLFDTQSLSLSLSQSLSTSKEGQNPLAHAAHEAGGENTAIQLSTKAKPQEYPPDFEEAWAAYPKRAGGNSKREAFNCWKARIRSGVQPQTLLDGVLRYAAMVRQCGKEGTSYVKQASTFFGPAEHYLDAYEVDPQQLMAAKLQAMNGGLGPNKQQLLEMRNAAVVAEYKRKMRESEAKEVS